MSGFTASDDDLSYSVLISLKLRERLPCLIELPRMRDQRRETHQVSRQKVAGLAREIITLNRVRRGGNEVHASIGHREIAPHLSATGQSITSARVTNEIGNWRSATASIHACRTEWFLLKRIETTFVSRSRTFTSRPGTRLDSDYEALGSSD
jgi:hypothetical protein